MVRTGKIAMPVDDEAFSKTWAYWQSSQALRKSLLDSVQMPAARDLVYVEDVCETSLSATTSLSHGTGTGNCPGEKAAQVGVAGQTSLLRGFLFVNSRSPHLVIDLWGHVGEMGKAVLHEKFNPCLGAPVYYLAFHADQVEAFC